jgi:hypothetical protein
MKRHNGANQRWKIIYLDEAKPVPKEGFNEDFGFYVNRPFYIVSRMPFKRIVQCHGATHVKLNKYIENRKDQ